MGVPLRVLGASCAAEAPDLAFRLNAAGHVSFAMGAAALLLFTLTVFRPDSRAARHACHAGVAAILVSTLGVFATGSVNDEQALSVLLTNIARVSALGWAFVESLRYFRMMRRRRELGLADPVVTDRFRLWSIWTGALALAPLLAALARVAARAGAMAGETALYEQYVGIAISLIRATLVLCAPLAVYGIWMSFFPPARYLKRIRARCVSQPA